MIQGVSMRLSTRQPVVLAACLAISLLGKGAAHGRPLPEPTEWTIDGVKRQALVVRPATPGEAPAPLVLVFHGHGGTMANMAVRGFQEQWPEAIFVFPQGLATVTLRDPQGGRAGWQNRQGANGDRDLRFVDAILTTMATRYRVDADRVYATGHSNGGGFTYLLWATRAERFAAVAPSSAAAAALLGVPRPKPLPILHLAGQDDEIVPFANQQLSMRLVRQVNGCLGEGRPWATEGSLIGTLYGSSSGADTVTVVHPGGHQMPIGAPALIIRFFKDHRRSTSTPASAGR